MEASSQTSNKAFNAALLNLYSQQGQPQMCCAGEHPLLTQLSPLAKTNTGITLQHLHAYQAKSDVRTKKKGINSWYLTLRLIHVALHLAS